MVGIHAVSGESADVEPRRTLVEQQVQPFGDGELAFGMLSRNALGTAAEFRLLELVVQFRELQLHRVHPALQFDFFRGYGHVRSLRDVDKVRPHGPVYF